MVEGGHKWPKLGYEFWQAWLTFKRRSLFALFPSAYESRPAAGHLWVAVKAGNLDLHYGIYIDGLHKTMMIMT